MPPSQRVTCSTGPSITNHIAPPTEPWMEVPLAKSGTPKPTTPRVLGPRSQGLASSTPLKLANSPGPWSSPKRVLPPMSSLTRPCQIVFSNQRRMGRLSMCPPAISVLLVGLATLTAGMISPVPESPSALLVASSPSVLSS